MAENDNEEIHGLLYSPEYLEGLIEKINSGVEVALSDLEELEIKKYLKMKTSQLFDDDDEDDNLSPEEEARRQRLLKQQLEEAKRKARTTDVTEIKLTDEQLQQLRKEMSSSFVRPNPNTVYNKSDDQLYKSAEEKVLSDKLNRVRNCYYDVDQWRTVMDLIMQAIEFELKSDKFAYIGPYERRLQAFTSGKLKLQINLPKLYLNRISPVSDPEVLRGIYNGEITVVDKSQLDGLHHKSYKNSPLVSMDVSPIGKAEYNYYLNWHRKGFQTPISGAIKAKSTIYNRYIDKGKDYDKTLGIKDERGIPIQYNWLDEGAQEYFRRLHKLKPNMDDIIDNVQKSNGGKINKILSERMNKVVRGGVNGYIEEKKDPNWLSASVQVKPDVVKLEQELLNAIQVTNP